jgi:hypothetical protein
VQTTVNQSASGDTVIVPGPCTLAWNTVNIDSTKGITVQASGEVTITSGGFNINPNGTTSTRITGFTFNGSGALFISNTPAQGGLGTAHAACRIDHNTFTTSNDTWTFVNMNGDPVQVDCLFDHNSFTGGGGGEFIHNNGVGGNHGDDGWIDVVTPGSQHALYLEDNTFTGKGGTLASGVQSYYGARTVARYNTLNNAQIDQHGTAGAVGARWWEFYDNTFNGGMLCLRAGSGIIFNNTGGGNTKMVEEDSGYPADYQVGRGENQTSLVAYVWNDAPLDLNQLGCAPPAANMVQLNRDVDQASSGTSLPGACTTGQGFWKTDEGGDWDTTHGGVNDGRLYKCTATNTWTAYYTPYTYPHPLQNTIDAPDGLVATAK